MQIKNGTALLGDCLEYMKTLPGNSIDIIFTDPPYALGSEIIIRKDGKVDYKKASDFMNKWDMPTAEFWEEWYREANRVLKYGGHCLMFGMDRQLLLFKYYAHLAGFTEKQSLYWFFISNFPKATDLSKMIDKNAGVKGEIIGESKGKGYTSQQEKNKDLGFSPYEDGLLSEHADKNIYAPGHELAKKYSGYKYSIAPLKQTNETIMVFQKPYKTGSCLHDTLAYENGDESITVGALDIDGCRVATNEELGRMQNNSPLPQEKGFNANNMGGKFQDGNEAGRYPSQTFCDSGTAEILDRDNDTSKILHKCDFETEEHDLYFYCPKVSKTERGENNNHPTLKPQKLLTNILSLFKTPNEQVLLDPFSGSFSIPLVCEKLGYKWIACEQSENYYNIGIDRITNQK